MSELLLSVAENVSKMSNQFCLFCYKTFTLSESSIVSDKLLKQFCTSLERFTSVSHNNRLLNLLPQVQHPCLQHKLGICSQCTVLINEFCTQYHQLKCLELNLKWNLDKLASIVKQANRIPERVRRIKCHLKTIQTDNGNQIGKTVSEFRDVLRKVSDKMILSEPRILLKRIDESCSKPRRTIITKSEISPDNAQELTLGWLLSFSAVTLLATTTSISVNHTTTSHSDFEPPEEDVDVLSVCSNRNIGTTQSTSKLMTSFSVNNSVGIPTNSEPDLESSTNETFFSDHQDDSIDEEPTSKQNENHQDIKVDTNQISIFRNSRHKCTLCSKSFKHVTTLRRHIKTVHSAKSNDRNPSTQKLFPCVFCKTSYITYRRYRAHVQLSASHEKLKKIYFQQQKLKRDALVDKSKSNSSTSKNKKRKVTKLTENRYNLRAKRMRSYCKVLAIDENEKETDADPEYNIAGESSDSDELSSTTTCSDSEDYAPLKTEIKPEPRQPATFPTKPKVNSNIPELKCKLEGCNLGFGQNQEKFEEHQKLHAPGNFKCNFCSQEDCSSIVQLANHERTKHPPENIPVTRKRLFYCPRCSYESLRRGNYQRHFASKHLTIFDPKKGQERATCQICQSSVLRELLDTHFQKFHDVSNMAPEKVKRCSIQGCAAYFKSIEQRKIHRQKVHKTEKCRKILESSEESDIELSGVSEDEQIMPGNSFKCKICKKQFQTLISFHQHKRRFHRKNVELSKPEKTSFGEFICPVMECIETFTGMQELQTHYKLHGNFKCKFCSLETILATDLALHESNEHTDNLDNPTFKCSRCPIFYEKKFAFIRHFCKRHLSLSTGSQLCPICNAEGSKRYLQKHKEVHHNIEGLKPEDIWRCDLVPCQAYFVTSTQLSVHKMRTHWNGKCPECDYIPKQDVRYTMNKLKIHMERKHPELLSHFKIRCTASSACTKLFESQVALEKHIEIVHRIMQCSKCEKTFASKAKLTKHENTVHGQRNFVCNECGKAFSTKDNLQNHMEYHKDPKDWRFECETCHKRFAHGGKLIEHKRTHTKEKPYPCQYCGEKYAHRHNWRNHMKTKHPTEFQESGNCTRRTDGIYVSRKGSKKGECLLSGGKSQN